MGLKGLRNGAIVSFIDRVALLLGGGFLPRTGFLQFLKKW